MIPPPEFEIFYQNVLLDHDFVSEFNKKTGANIKVGVQPNLNDNQIFTAYLRKFFETHFGQSTTKMFS